MWQTDFTYLKIIGWRQVLQTFMVPLAVVVIDERLDLLFKITL